MTDAPITLRAIEPRGSDLEAEHDLRYRVLRAPLSMGRETVGFAHEQDCWHLVAEREGVIVGCVLFHPDEPGGGRLLQMAVDPALQGQGVGSKLVQALEARVRAAGFLTIHLHARDTAIGFYERLGYAIDGPPYTEVGLPHHDMRKRWA